MSIAKDRTKTACWLTVHRRQAKPLRSAWRSIDRARPRKGTVTGQPQRRFHVLWLTARSGNRRTQPTRIVVRRLCRKARVGSFGILWRRTQSLVLWALGEWTTRRSVKKSQVQRASSRRRWRTCRRRGTTEQRGCRVWGTREDRRWSRPLPRLTFGL